MLLRNPWGIRLVLSRYNARSWAGHIGRRNRYSDLLLVTDETARSCRFHAYRRNLSNKKQPACGVGSRSLFRTACDTRGTSIYCTRPSIRHLREYRMCYTFLVLMAELDHHLRGTVDDIPRGSHLCWYVFRGVTLLVLTLSGHLVLALRWFLLRRMQFTAVLHASSGGLSTGRYLRLISLTLVDVTIVIFGALYQIINNFRRFDLSAYGTWQEAHQDFGQIQQFAEDVASDVTVNAMTLYLLPLYSFVFFIFFGFGEEAIREYLAFGRTVRRWCEPLWLKPK